MKLTTLLIGLAITPLGSLPAGAAEPGPEAPKTPYVKPTPQERATARAARKQDGQQANGQRASEPDTSFPAASPAVPAADKQAARAARKQETRRAVKAGETQTPGELGPKR